MRVEPEGEGGEDIVWTPDGLWALLWKVVRGLLFGSPKVVGDEVVRTHSSTRVVNPRREGRSWGDRMDEDDRAGGRQDRYGNVGENRAGWWRTEADKGPQRRDRLARVKRARDETL
jgi:hypothetical protein